MLAGVFFLFGGLRRLDRVALVGYPMHGVCSASVPVTNPRREENPMLWYLGYVVLFVDEFDGIMDFYAKKVGLPVRLRAEGYAEFAVEGAKFALLSRSRAAELTGATPSGRQASGTDSAAVTVLVE